MTETAISWRRSAKIFWAILWRALLGIAVIAVPIEILIFWILRYELRWSADMVTAINQIVAMSIAIPCWITAVKLALNKKYKDFQIAVTEVLAPPP